MPRATLTPFILFRRNSTGRDWLTADCSTDLGRSAQGSRARLLLSGFLLPPLSRHADPPIPRPASWGGSHQSPAPSISSRSQVQNRRRRRLNRGRCSGARGMRCSRWRSRDREEDPHHRGGGTVGCLRPLRSQPLHRTWRGLPSHPLRGHGGITRAATA